MGGYPEVTCVWYDKKYGVWMKCRYDYLKVMAINDLKTFTRNNGKDIDQFLPHHITNYRYNIQGTHYIESLEYAKDFAKNNIVYGDVCPKWLKAFSERPCEQFHFIFQQKEEVPNVYEVIYSIHHSMHESSKMMIEQAVKNFKQYRSIYGDDMWVDIRDTQVLTDDDYPVWAY